jgi:DNA polymerase III delta subunit
MDYLLYGPDLKLRDTTLHAIRQDVLTGPSSASLDCESLDANKLSAEKLKIALYALPGSAPRRLVHIFRAEKLTKENGEMITAFLKADHAHAVVVIEAESWDASAKWRAELTRLLKVSGTEAPAAGNVFDMMNAVMAGNGAGALQGLNVLMLNDEAPEKLLGGMLWVWSNKARARIAAGIYKKGLLLLQEADRALKRGHYPERENALEVLVVKLSLLVKPSKV